MVRRSVVTWLALLLLTPVASFAQGPLVVSVWGGNWKDTVDKVVGKAFTARTGIPVEYEVGGTIYYEVGWDGTYGKLGQIFIPAFALGFPYASIVARLTRASMLEVLKQDYVRTARAKGLTDRIVIIRHALRNALIPVVTILGPLTIGIITGSVVIENIFGIPGLGKEFVNSILSRDYNIVIGVFTFYAAAIGVANLLVDLLYTAIDPRIRY